MEENTLSVLKIAPGQYPQQVEIDNDLKALQQAVGGSIGASYPFADPVAIVYADDGKLMGLPLNRALRDEDGQMYDAVAGLTVDPDQNRLVYDFCRKLEDKTLADWYDQMFYFVRSEMEHYTMMQKMSRDIEEDEDWGPTIFDESEEEELIDDV